MSGLIKVFFNFSTSSEVVQWLVFLPVTQETRVQFPAAEYGQMPAQLSRHRDTETQRHRLTCSTETQRHRATEPQRHRDMNGESTEYIAHSGPFSIRGSIVASIPACHAGDPVSIPGRGDSLWSLGLTQLLVTTSHTACDAFRT